MSNFHFLKKDLEWKIVNLQDLWDQWPTNCTLSYCLLWMMYNFFVTIVTYIFIVCSLYVALCSIYMFRCGYMSCPFTFFIACIVTIRTRVVNLLQRGAFCSHFCYIIWLQKKSPIIVQVSNYILLHPDIVREAHSYPSPLLFPSLPLSSILVQERKYPFTGSPEMSDKLRYEWRLYLHTFTTPFAFFGHYIFSLEQQLKRENYTPIHHYTPFRGSPEMSDKLRYESQIILRYYLHIIHEVSLERHTTTSTFTTIHLERKTTPHFLSHWTTHLQYWRNYYAYSLTQ